MSAESAFYTLDSIRAADGELVYLHDQVLVQLPAETSNDLTEQPAVVNSFAGQ